MMECIASHLPDGHSLLNQGWSHLHGMTGGHPLHVQELHDACDGQLLLLQPQDVTDEVCRLKDLIHGYGLRIVSRRSDDDHLATLPIVARQRQELTVDGTTTHFTPPHLATLRYSLS